MDGEQPMVVSNSNVLGMGTHFWKIALGKAHTVVFINGRLRSNSKGTSLMTSSGSLSNDVAKRNEVTAAGGEHTIQPAWLKGQ